MKKIFIILVALLATLVVFAQSPQKMSYQAVIRNSANNLVTSHAVGMRVSIIQGSVTGTEVYKEIYNPNPQTNANGLLTIEIGSGIPLTGSFATINWANAPYFIKTETDPTGGTNYTITGTSQLLSVPYALYAKTAENISGGIIETDPVFGAHPANGITSALIVNWNTAYSWGNHNGLYRPMTYVPAWSEITSNPFLITSAANNQLLKYNSTTSKWENWTPNFLTTYNETDPVFGAHPANGITSALIVNWNTAYSWGNHSGLYRPMTYVPAWSEITSNPFLITSAVNNQLLKYNSTSAKWENWTPNFLTAYNETDPVFGVHPANGITSALIVNWNTAYSWGNHNGLYRPMTYVPAWSEITSNPFLITSAVNNQLLKYNSTSAKWENWTPNFLSTYTETDPVFGAHPANGITSALITNWNTAYSWGNHNGLYRPMTYVPAWSEITSNPFLITSEANNQLLKYNSTTSKWENWTPSFLTTYTETDPAWTSASINYYTKTNMQNSGTSQLHFNNLTNKPTTVSGYGISDAMTTAHIANTITLTNINNWTSAYSWGNHAGLYRPMTYVPAWSEITSNPFLITSAANNQLLKYNTATSKWENWTPNYITTIGTNRNIIYNNNGTLSGSGSFVFDYNNNSVGIGIPSPTAGLHVVKTNDIVARFVGDNYGASSNTYVGIKDQTAGVDWYLEARYDGAFAIHQEGYSERITIDNNTGNVGIGTSSPAQMLDVAGGAIRTNNQFISTVATGTAPLNVTSTTAVTNLNADMVDGKHQEVNTQNLQFSTAVNTTLHTFYNSVLETVSVTGRIQLRCTSSLGVYWIAYLNGVRTSGSLPNTGNTKTWDMGADNNDLKIIITAQVNNLDMGIVEIHRVNTQWTAATIIDSFSAN
ncbi:MAG: hypothetical protein NTZ33_02100 [Bacteroidetes bacterium]|nr:hypothetical protein [Bacteroidota bacterium]